MGSMGKKDRKEAPIIQLRRLMYLVICMLSFNLYFVSKVNCKSYSKVK